MLIINSDASLKYPAKEISSSTLLGTTGNPNANGPDKDIIYLM